ncbi:MAG: long-chain-fatty-acid--CoA ligase [Deltaproteobacteria bacterium]|nr:long-chain-fatty-acid--CoA ligase [Deltaproteobacteria bacterium]
MLLSELPRRSARLEPNIAAGLDRGRQITNRQWRERMLVQAAWLRAHGSGPGKRVAVLSYNRIEMLDLYFSIPAIGAVIVPVNYRLKAYELEYQFSDAEVDILFVEKALWPEAKTALLKIPRKVTVIGLDFSGDGVLPYENTVSGPPLTDLPVFSEHETALQAYTSGTTGRPKGVLLTHRNMLANSWTGCIEKRIYPGEKLLHSAPLFHLAAISSFYSTALIGGTHVFLPAFDPKAVVDTIEKERITFCLFVPTMINMLLEMPGIEKRDFSSLKIISYGGSSIPVDRLRKAIEVFGCGFVQGYGQTEAAPILTTLRPEEHVLDGPLSKRLASAGREAVGCEVRVVRPDGSDVTPGGEVGEVVGRGDNIMKGYWKQPEATAETLRGGWLHTGDLGWIDEDGYIYIVDRLKDMIISGGENIYPREIEELLYTHPKILEAAVYGIPDPKWGEKVIAAVVPRAGQSLTPEEVGSFCKDNLASYKKPREVLITDILPRNAAGKVLKTELRARHGGG